MSATVCVNRETEEKHIEHISVADPHHRDADPDPHPACH